MSSSASASGVGGKRPRAADEPSRAEHVPVVTGDQLSQMRREQSREDPDSKGLHLLIQTFTGQRLTIDQPDGTVVEGTLVSADDKMKCVRT